jgi:hypothetical protein
LADLGGRWDDLMRVSELISELVESGDNRAAARLEAMSRDKRIVAQLEAMFAESVFGLLMSGLPKGGSGQAVVVDGSGSVKMPRVIDSNGKSMIKACADPELFDVNYPGCINATMPGRALLEMAEKIPDADGILICSATSPHSFPIYKAAYARVKGAKPSGAHRKWWQFWKAPTPAKPVPSNR